MFPVFPFLSAPLLAITNKVPIKATIPNIIVTTNHPGIPTPRRLYLIIGMSLITEVEKFFDSASDIKIDAVTTAESRLKPFTIKFIIVGT